MTVTYETLAAIYHIAKIFIYADGEMSKEELKPLLDFYDTFPDLQGEKFDMVLQHGDKMETERALELIEGLDADGKQQISNLFAKIICIDNELTDKEKDVFFKVRDICGLPDPDFGDSNEEEAQEGQEPATEDNDENDPIIPAYIVVNYRGQYRIEQSEHEDWSTLGGELAEWIGASGVEIVRFTPALNKLSEELRLNQRHLVFMVARNGYDHSVGDNMPATLLYGRGYPLYGDIVFAIETDQGYELEGFLTKKILKEALVAINDAVDGLIRPQ